jgi:hypothetical protein
MIYPCNLILIIIHFILAIVEHASEKKGGRLQLDFSKVTIGKLLGEGGSGCKVYMCTVQGMTCAVKVTS